VRRSLLLLPLLCVGLTGCTAPPHIFVVTTDEPAIRAVMTINGQSVTLAEKGGRFAGDTAVVEGSAIIVVTLRSGRQVTCTIGYFTNGEFEPHRLAVKNGQCTGA
jgi:uncharacterized lipoprotein YajG